MKQVFTISIDEKLAAKIREAARTNTKFRNKSHLVEQSIEKFFDSEEKVEQSKSRGQTK